MITRANRIENEIRSLASSIKKNMVDPPGQRLERLEARVAALERALSFLARGFFAASAAFAAAMGAVIYFLAGN